MKRSNLYAVRNIKEFLRDPLSYVFGLGFPVIMLIIMTLINNSIPAEYSMDIFGIKKLSAGIAVFGATFIMLFTALQVSKDRSGSFLIRLYATPLKSSNFMAGYLESMLLMGLAQAFISYICAFIIGLVVDVPLSVFNVFIAAITMIIPNLMFTSFGLLFGSLLSDKAAPALCSIGISLCSILGGVFMDLDGVGGVLLKISKILPFYHCVKLEREAVAGNYAGMWAPMLVVLIYTVTFILAAIFTFSRKMKADLN